MSMKRGRKNRLHAETNSLDEIGISKIKSHRWQRMALLPDEELTDYIDDAVKRLQAERDENTCRVNFTPTEAVELGKRLEALEKPKAEERRKATQNNDAAKSSSGNLPEQDKGDTRDKVAEAVGMSGACGIKGHHVP